MLAVSGRHVIGQVNVNILYITLFQRQKTVAKKKQKIYTVQYFLSTYSHIAYLALAVSFFSNLMTQFF